MAPTVVSLDLSFRDNEELRFAYHSFANLINVIHAELQLLERMADGDPGLRPTIRLCEAATWSYKDPETAADNAPALASFRKRVISHIDRITPLPDYLDDAREARELIREVLDGADFRIQEMLARHDVPRPKVRLQHGDLSSEFAGGSSADPRITLGPTAELVVPTGLPEALGRFARAVADLTDDEVEVSMSMDDGGSFSASVDSEPVTAAVVPSAPPSGEEPSSTEERLRSLVALVSYVAGPASRLTIDPTGKPLLHLHCPPS